MLVGVSVGVAGMSLTAVQPVTSPKIATKVIVNTIRAKGLIGLTPASDSSVTWRIRYPLAALVSSPHPRPVDGPLMILSDGVGHPRKHGLVRFGQWEQQRRSSLLIAIETNWRESNEG